MSRDGKTASQARRTRKAKPGKQKTQNAFCCRLASLFSFNTRISLVDSLRMAPWKNHFSQINSSEHDCPHFLSLVRPHSTLSLPLHQLPLRRLPVVLVIWKDGSSTGQDGLSVLPGGLSERDQAGARRQHGRGYDASFSALEVSQ